MSKRLAKNSNSPSSKGGIANGIKLRKQSIENYYKSPNICLYCNNPIKVGDNQQVGHVRIKKYCNKHCFGKHVGGRNIKYIHTGPRIIRKCSKCNSILNFPENGARKYCLDCRKDLSIGQKKKKDADRSAISGNARAVVKERPKICEICNYNKFVEVCHKKAIKDFDDESLVSEINSLDNLILLCPNCHWEFDHNLLTL